MNLKTILDPDVIGAIIIAMGAITAALITKFKGNKRVREETVKSYTQPNPIPNGVKKNTILVVGMGRVGKTQLISCLMQHSPKEFEVTEDFRIYKRTVRYDDDQDIIYYINDYRGQNFGQLISSFIREQFKPHTILRYGDINSLILIVDILPELSQENQNVSFASVDHTRIKDQIELWNVFVLDAIFALFTKDTLKYVCLFINKIDKLEVVKEEDIKNLFTPLSTELEKRTKKSGAAFEVITGSAYKGTNITGINSLSSHLNKHSVTRKKDL